MYTRVMIFDTHCHIHDPKFFTPSDAEEVYLRAFDAEVAMVCVGTSGSNSREAVAFATNHERVWAVAGVHPHEAKGGVADIGQLLAEEPEKLVGIGEIGLDYHYTHSPRESQIAAFEQQLQWALDYKLPVSFHVRDAFDDFWPIVNNFPTLRGVLHSFTDSEASMEKAIARGLYIGVNGISTFTKDSAQQEMFRRIPLDHLLLETDAPFLTPAPYRGKVNEPGRVREVAQFHATIRNLSFEEIAARTNYNATALFGI